MFTIIALQYIINPNKVDDKSVDFYLHGINYLSVYYYDTI